MGVLVVDGEIGGYSGDWIGVEGRDREDRAELEVLDVLEDVGASVKGGDGVVDTNENVNREEAAEVSVMRETVEGGSNENGFLLIEERLLETFKDGHKEGGNGQGLEMFIIFFKDTMVEKVMGIVRVREIQFIIMDEEEGIDEVETIGCVRVDRDFWVVGIFEVRAGAACMEENGHEDGSEVGKDVDLVLVGGLVRGGGGGFQSGEEVGGGLVGGDIRVGDGSGLGSERLGGRHCGTRLVGL